MLFWSRTLIVCFRLVESVAVSQGRALLAAFWEPIVMVKEPKELSPPSYLKTSG